MKKIILKDGFAEMEIKGIGQLTGLRNGKKRFSKAHITLDENLNQLECFKLARDIERIGNALSINN